MQTTRPCIIACCVVAVIAVVTGVLIGYYSGKSSSVSSASTQRQKGQRQGVDPSIKSKLLEEIKADNIKENLRFLTRKAHLAGTPADLEGAQYIRDRWREYGLDVEIVPYDVLLSYPEDNHNNTVSLVDTAGRTLYTTSAGDTVLKLAPDQAEGVQPFNAFSPSGNPQGELVYANYGRESDFDELQTLGINCTGKIAIARYGKIFRGNKALAAYQAGAIGLIIYSDPQDYLDSNNFTDVFPNSWWLPGSGVQRGGLSVNKGDQFTPGYPSTWYAYRLNETEINKRLPQIPVHPISYNDALPLLRAMGGPEVPDSFKGGLPITYRLGPVMANGSMVKMDIRNYRAKRTTYNVIGKIKGVIEEDRYVLLGNHRDAWIQGGIDPTSGTATMLEISRAVGELLKGGWRPRRSMMFCSWGAEEYGMVGSIEWVEENLRVLDRRAVAYLNIDSAVQGGISFKGKAVPLLNKLMMDATKQVEDPNDPTRTVYDTWLEKRPDGETGQPKIAIPGSGSDYHAFILTAGIPVTSSRYNWDTNLPIASYPLYHTAYDLFSLMMLIDPDFRYHRTMARVNSVMLLELTDSGVLPLDVPRYGLTIVQMVDKLEIDFGSLPGFLQRNITFDPVMSAARNFSRAATLFQNRLKSVDTSNDLQVRMVNDQLMAVERAFIDPLGLPDRQEMRHVVFAPSLRNTYAGVAFPGIYDLLHKISDTDEDRWREVKKHISVITYAIQSAANTLSL